MNEQEKILGAFLEEKLTNFDKDNEKDKRILHLLSETISLKTEIRDEEGNYRTVFVAKDSDGKITAYSIKLSNIFQADLAKQFKFLSKAFGVFPIVELLKFTTGFLAVLAIFLPMLKMEFNEQDAKILLAINKSQKKEFSVSDVKKHFKTLEFASISDEKMNASMVKLSNAKILRALGHGKYLLREKIKYAK